MPISFGFDGPNTTRLIAATCANRGYTDFVDNGAGVQIPNPVTRAAFAKRWWRDQMEAEVRNVEESETVRTTRAGFTGIGDG